MWHSKEELLNFQRDGEIPCSPLGLIQSSRGGAIFVGGRIRFRRNFSNSFELDFVYSGKKTLPREVEARNSVYHNVVDRTCIHSPENSTFRDLKLHASLRSRCRLTR